jgi:CubicO group peptidase (beta-lactamase class C family)
VRNVARFSVELDDDRLLKQETRDWAFTPTLSSKGKSLAYGLGWFVQERKRGKPVWHYGWWDGDSSLIIKVPGRNLTFILLANSDGLSCKFDLGKDEDVTRSPFPRAYLNALGR